jgi:replicative DNA helicase
VSETAFENKNVQAEMCLIGCFYKNPDLYLTSGQMIKSKYDFTDGACKFLYTAFEEYYLTFSTDVSEGKVNNYMSQHIERLKQYKQYGGWKTIRSLMDLADAEDFKNYFNIVKKYSLIREYARNGFPAEKILSHQNFQMLTANDVYRLMRAKADNINSVVNVLDEPVVLTKDTIKTVDSYLLRPQMGILTPWKAYNDCFKGLLPGRVLIQAFKSNQGKSRNLTYLIAYVTLIQKQKFMMLSNEMTEADIKNCLLVSVYNNKVFQDLHGVYGRKPEEEIVLGKYRTDENPHQYIERKENETDDEYIERVKATKDYQNVKKVCDWMELQLEGKFYFKDITDDYSNERLEMEIRKAKVVYNCSCFAFDTAKAAGGNDDWKELKHTITNIVELAKQLGLSGICTYQLSDESENIPIFEFNSTQLASSKQVRHVVDCLTMGRRLREDELHLCQYIPFEADDAWGEVVEQDLDPHKTWFGIKVDKNRAGANGSIILFEIDLDINVWTCKGYLIKKK